MVKEKQMASAGRWVRGALRRHHARSSVINKRSVVQLRVPSTEFVFQFVVNNGGRDNPVILSIFTPLDLKDIRDIILGKGKGAP